MILKVLSINKSTKGDLMKSFEAFCRGLRSVRKAKKMTQEELAEKAETSSGYISKLERMEEGRSISWGKSQDIADVLGVNIEDIILAGKKTPPTKIDNQESKNALLKPETVTLKYFPEVYASAGNGTINYDEAVSAMTFESSFLREQFGIQKFSNMHIIRVTGDSMQPTLNPGDYLFVNPSETDITTGSVYVINCAGDIYVKRIKKQPFSKSLTLYSDNPEHEPIEIKDQEKLDKTVVIGRVIGRLERV